MEKKPIAFSFLNPFLCTTNYLHFFPAWSPTVWNTVCISASVTQGYYRGNINGRLVWEMKDFDWNLLKTVKVV